MKHFSTCNPLAKEANEKLFRDCLGFLARDKMKNYLCGPTQHIYIYIHRVGQDNGNVAIQTTAYIFHRITSEANY